MPPAESSTIHTLYSDHHRWLHGWLRQRLDCSEQAADLAQDTFLRLLDRDRQQLLSLQQPRAYLRVIAGGLLTDHFRRRSLERAYLQALATLPEPATISLEEREIILEALHCIDVVLQQLPQDVRNAFLWSQLEGLSYQQIAQRLSVSERTVKRYMQQGFARCLRAML